MIKPVARLTQDTGCNPVLRWYSADIDHDNLPYGPLYAIPEGYSITEDKASWEVKKLLALAWEAVQEAGYEDHSFELRDKIDQYLDEAGGVK